MQCHLCHKSETHTITLASSLALMALTLSDASASTTSEHVGPAEGLGRLIGS
jgi:hypothetical protein